MECMEHSEKDASGCLEKTVMGEVVNAVFVITGRAKFRMATERNLCSPPTAIHGTAI